MSVTPPQNPAVVHVLAEAGIEASFDHVAHAAPSIASLLPIYRDLLGGEFVRGGANPRFGYRAVQLCYADGTRIELLEPVKDSTFLDRFFERNPRGGLHHVTFKVNNVRGAAAAAEKAGFAITGAHFPTSGRQEAFLHPRGALGALIQMVQVDPDYRSPRANRTLEAALGAE